MSILKKTAMYWHFAQGLRHYLKEPLTISGCREIISNRLQSREDNFLNLARLTMFGNETSPYQALLNSAGCEYGDMEQLVKSDGLDIALKTLADKGVYVSEEEFKGREAAQRGSQRFHFNETDFDNPLQNGLLEASTGASRGTGTRTIYDFAHLAEKWAVHQALRLDAYDALDLPVGMWLPIMPGAGPVALLAYIKAGIVPEKWFSPVTESDFGPALRNRLGTLYIVHATRFFGTRVPVPEHIPLNKATRVAHWISDMIAKKGGCYMATYVSAAARIAEAAKRDGLDLSGALFSVSSEPFTEAKKKEIETSGASVFPMYAFMEAGIVGIGCKNPSSVDDYHLLSECIALCQRSRETKISDIPVDAFLWTSLLTTSPKILFNVETGDYGVIEKRDCGCRLEDMGFTTHVSHVRSFEKLTGEGMSFSNVDVFNIIETILPAVYGGRSTDYQLVEEEDDNWKTRLTIIASPGLGDLDESQIISTVLRELRKGTDAERMMTKIWEQGDSVRVKRIRPFTTSRGKQLPLHIVKQTR